MHPTASKWAKGRTPCSSATCPWSSSRRSYPSPPPAAFPRTAPLQPKGRESDRRAAASGARDGGEAPHGLCERVGCSDPQRSELAEIRKTTRERLGALGRADKDVRATLAKALREDDLTTAELETILAARETDQAARREILAESLAKVHDVLDAKQRETLALAVEKHGLKAVMGGHHPHGPAGKGGKGKPGKGNGGKRGPSEGARDQ